MKNFEQGDTGENVGHAVIAVPPERNAGDKERQLHRILSGSGNPHSHVIRQPKNRYRHCSKEQSLLQSVNSARRNKWQTASVKSLQGIGHPGR